MQPLVDFVLGGGRGTVFAYGQTGSGKTFTMMGIQKFIAEDLFLLLEASEENLQVFLSFFEIYGGRCQVRTPRPRALGGPLLLLLQTCALILSF